MPIRARAGVEYLYSNYSFHHCAAKEGKPRISAKCEQFLMWEEAFYSCDPYIGLLDKDGDNITDRLPICRSFADEWYAACKNDYSCVRDWINDWDFSNPNNITCPADSTCKCVRGRQRRALAVPPQLCVAFPPARSPHAALAPPAFRCSLTPNPPARPLCRTFGEWYANGTVSAAGEPHGWGWAHIDLAGRGARPRASDATSCFCLLLLRLPVWPSPSHARRLQRLTALHCLHLAPLPPLPHRT